MRAIKFILLTIIFPAFPQTLVDSEQPLRDTVGKHMFVQGLEAYSSASYSTYEENTKTSGISKTTNDYSTTFNLGFVFVPMEKLKTSLFVYADYTDREVLENEDDPTVASYTKQTQLHATLALDYTTSKGLGIFGGYRIWHLPTYETTEESSALKTTVTTSSATLGTLFFGLVKKTPLWHIAAYYKLNTEAGRDIERHFESSGEAIAPTSSRSDTIAPAEISAHMGYGNREKIKFDFSVALLQAGSASTEADDGSQRLFYEDHYAVTLKTTWMLLNPYGVGFFGKFRSASYRDQTTANLATLPVTEARAIFLWQSLEVTAGLSRIDEVQSIPEFNKEHNMLRYIFSASLNIPTL